MNKTYANLTGKYADPWYPIPRWRRAAISCVACLLGVQVNINGFPYGASYARHKITSGNDTGYDFGPPPPLLSDDLNQPRGAVVG